MKRLLSLSVLVLAAASFLLHLGCEVESSADTQLNLNPRSITLQPGQSATFTVSGGYDYRWSLSIELLGTLNRRTGNQVVYTATSTNAGIQNLAVESWIEGASGNTPTNIMGTNGIVATSVSATAVIAQPGTSGRVIPNPVSTLTVTPSSVTLTPGSPTVTFTVAEGVAATWTVQNGSLGTPNSGTGRTFTYLALSFPSNAVTQTIEASYRPAGSSSALTDTITVTQKAAN